MTLKQRFLVFCTSILLGAFFVACSNEDNPVQPAYEFAGMEEQTLQLINQHRSGIGKDALQFQDDIIKVARQHSQNMADGSVKLGHDGFTDRVSMIKSKITVLNAGENVAYNSGFQDPAATAVDGWLKSQAHKDNIQEEYNLTGIGIARSSGGAYYFTQIFVESH